MQAIAINDGTVEWRGALEVERTDAGYRARRLPDWTRPQLPNEFTDFIVGMPSGVRLAFRTAATAIELEVVVTHLMAVGDTASPHAVAFDLVVDGQRTGQQLTSVGPVARLHPDGSFDVPMGAATTLRFQDLGDGAKDIEVWLPQRVVVDVVRLMANLPVLPPSPVPSSVRRWVHHGSSISHGFADVSPCDNWPVQVARRVGVDLTNLALGGNAHLDPFVARTIRDYTTDLISLKLGINVMNGDSFRLRSFTPALHGFLDTIRDGHPDAPLLVISPLVCPMVEAHPGPTVRSVGSDRLHVLPRSVELSQGALTLRMMREVMEQVVATRALSDPHLGYLDGTLLIGEDDVDLIPDGLHLSDKGNDLVAQRFEELAFGAHRLLAEQPASSMGLVV